MFWCGNLAKALVREWVRRPDFVRKVPCSILPGWGAGGVNDLQTRGNHLLLEYFGCSAARLDDLSGVEAAMNRAAREAGATVVASVFHPFAPQGVSGVVVVEESHLSIHTWPESGYAAVDFFTCGTCEPKRAHEVLKAFLGATQAEILHVERGIEGPRSMRVVDSRREQVTVRRGEALPTASLAAVVL